MIDERLERWLDELLETPGLTAIESRDDAYRVHVEGSLAALPHVARFGGPIVDVGSGGGSPGIPLAVALPDREITLLEANARKAAFLERIAASFPNVEVVRGRAEEQESRCVRGRRGAGARTAAGGRRMVSAARAAVRRCRALRRAEGGSRSRGAVAAKIGGGEPELEAGAIVIPKVAPTPPGYPRRPGMARKRPLA